MTIPMRALDYLATRAFWVARWFAAEFLSIAIGLDASAIVTSLSRVFAVAVMLFIVRTSLSHGLTTGALAAATQCVFAGLVGLVVANIAKESAIDFGARVLGWLGRDFHRTGATLDGKIYRQTLHANGTWIRCESGPAGIVCEWTDTTGACNRIETRPQSRPAWLRRRTTTSPCGADRKGS